MSNFKTRLFAATVALALSAGLASPTLAQMTDPMVGGAAMYPTKTIVDNEAFAKLPPNTVPMLLQADNKPTLIKVLTYHVVAGRLSAADLMAEVQAGGGKATLTTVEGEPLIVTSDGQDLVLTDAKGGMSRITIADVNQSNGVIHVVDTVLMP